MKILLVLCISAVLIACKTHVVKSPMPPGKYTFQYVRSHFCLDTSKKLWNEIYKLDVNMRDWLEVKSDSLILMYSPNKIRTVVDTFRSQNFDGFVSKLPENYLDYKFVGVYEDIHLPEFYNVFYYSQKRRSFMYIRTYNFNQSFSVVIFYENADTVNPFKNVDSVFNMAGKVQKVITNTIVK